MSGEEIVLTMRRSGPQRSCRSSLPPGWCTDEHNPLQKQLPYKSDTMPAVNGEKRPTLREERESDESSGQGFGEHDDVREGV